MNWVSNFLTSSIGKKLIMSLTGIFLILFITVHLVGNLQLLIPDGGETFNLYAKLMTTNPVIQTIAIGNYFFILLHAIQGILLWRKNSAARGSKYAVKKVSAKSTSGFASSNMGWLGTIIFIFLLVHLYQFWLQMKLDVVPYVDIDGVQVKNLYEIVTEAFLNPIYSIFYIICMIVLAFHLWHGFQSSFQTLGLTHKKYTPFIQGLGKVYAVVVPLGFAIIPLFFLLGMHS